MSPVDPAAASDGSLGHASGLAAVVLSSTAPPALADGPVDAAQGTAVLEGELASVRELAFAFRRASSRLVEMAGLPYSQSHAAAWPDARALPPPGAWGK